MSVKDPTKMTAAEKYNYIFEPQKDYYVHIRFDWFNSLLSDIRTLIQGGQQLRNTPSAELGGNFGAGNVSIPILVCIGLELASALYTGTTRAKDGNKYKANKNVKKFVEDFFPKQGVMIPLILWDGIRNGNAHLFMPNTFKVKDTEVSFTFVVSMTPYKVSHASKSNNEINIRFNGIEFYHVFKSALECYKNDLEHDDTLQNKFISAWESIDNAPHRIPSEVTLLNNRLELSDRVNIFSNPHNGLLLSSYYQDKPDELAQLVGLILRAL